jgi:hypothetical protein
MGLFDALLGRSKPVAANLDRLFGLPSAQITLEASEGLLPTEQAGVCFKPAVGQAFAATETELSEMLELTDSDSNQPNASPISAKLSEEADEYGYRWVVVGADDFDTLVTRRRLDGLSCVSLQAWDVLPVCSDRTREAGQ